MGLVLAFVVGLAVPVLASGTSGALTPNAKPCNSTTHPENGLPPCTTTTPPPPTIPTVPTVPVPPSGPTPVLIPQAGHAAVASVVSGVVSFRRAGAKSFTKLVGSELVPVGSTIDTRHGTLGLSTSNGAGNQFGQFHAGMFTVKQARHVRLPKARGARAAAVSTWTTVLILRGGSLGACDRDDAHGHFGPEPGKAARAASVPRRRRHRRRLWASESGGSWTTVGGDAAATVRGTEWLTQDTCAGTLVRVKSGVVVVRNLFTGRRVRLTAGHSYLAKAPDVR